MLTDVVDLHWQGDVPATGRGAFPAELERAAELHDPSTGPFLVRIGLIYRSLGVILLDTPVHWAPAQRAFLIGERQGAILRQRLARSRAASGLPVETARCGIAERLARPPFSGAVADLLGSGPRSVPEADAIVFTPDGAERQDDGLPDAAAFHSIAMPRSLTLKIEPTTRCNFHCGFCYGRHLKQGDLSEDAFDAVLSRFPDLQAVELTGEGEPLLNKKIYGFVERLSRRGIYTHLTTNGSALNEHNIARLLDAGLRSLAVSMESLVPTTFARFRPGGDADEVIAGIRRVVAMKRARGADLTVSLWTTLMRDTIHEIPAFRHFAESAGIDHFECFQTLNPLPSYVRFYDRHLLDNMLSEDECRQMAADPGIDPQVRQALTHATAVYRQTSCGIFMDTVMVNWQGEMTPCCLLKFPDTPSLGNLRRESLEDIWAKPVFGTFRFALQHGIVLEACRGCPDVSSARSDWEADPC